MWLFWLVKVRVLRRLCFLLLAKLRTAWSCSLVLPIIFGAPYHIEMVVGDVEATYSFGAERQGAISIQGPGAHRLRRACPCHVVHHIFVPKSFVTQQARYPMPRCNSRHS